MGGTTARLGLALIMAASICFVPHGFMVYSAPLLPSVGELRDRWSVDIQSPIQGRLLRLGLQPDLADPGVFVAQERGWLAEAGLALEVRHLGWGEIMDSLAAGGLDLGLISPTAHLSARALGHDLRVVAAGPAEPPAAPTRRLATPAGSPLDKAGDLVGRRVGVPALGGADHLMLQAWLGRHGIDAASVQFVELPPALLVAGLFDGGLDAALLPEPYLSAAVERGARALESPYADLAGPTPLAYFVADAGWLAGHAHVARRFAVALHRAHAALQADPAAYRAATVRHLGRDPAFADRVALPALETRVTPAQLQAWADAFPAQPAGRLSPLALVAPDVLFDSVR
jgi:NitT/TauT family transport system substrate-binding protein